MLCVVTNMEDPKKTTEEKNMLGDLDEEESKFILEKKILELTLTSYVDRENI